MRTAVIVALLVLIAPLAAPPSTATAQQRRKAPKVIQLEEIKIEGRVQKPNAFYILNRSNIGYEVMDLRAHFIRKVIESVRREPF